MSSLDSDEYLVAYISGVNADGTVAATSFHTWKGDDPATYSIVSDQRKWGASTAGTDATISYAFAPASHWTATEESAFTASMHLWQAEAGVTFVPASSPYTANVTITRGSDGTAEGYLDGTSVFAGTSTLGHATNGGIEIDPSKAGFGPIGAPFGTYGGYPWMTVEHEIGHAMGLGHAGAYNGDGDDLPENGTDDNRALSIMSYFEPNYSWGTYPSDYEPVTPMALDIVALQRLYGMPQNSPLAGNDVFGFNSNIQGDIRQFFDFSIDTHPIVTLWSSGGNNTLDLSGFSTASNGSLLAGSVGDDAISAGGLGNNIAIAYDTHIDTVLLGAGDDTFRANDDSDYLIGGAGADTLTGGAGNDHIYGGGMVQTPGDGADTLSGGAGGDYLQGNAGNDTIDGGAGDDRIQGGADNDALTGGDGNDAINGNLGNDTIGGGAGNDLVRGGQGDDTIIGDDGNDTVMGDLGNDQVAGGRGVDLLYGGDGSDVFVFSDRNGYINTVYDAYLLDQVADYASGTDHLHLDMGTPSVMVDLGVEVDMRAAYEAASALLTAPDMTGNILKEVVKAAVGGGTAVYFLESGVGVEGFQIDGLSPASLTSADFV